MATFLRIALFSFALHFGLAARGEEPRISNPHFLGPQSCKSTACHGGGVYAVIKRDVHQDAHIKLGLDRSKQMVEALGITDATRSARCTVCHSPLQALPTARLAKNAKIEPGVSCETCHGPAENYLLSHTRKDYTHEQRVAVGIRPAEDFYNRANICIACHHMVDADLLNAGHPELFFEFDRLMATQPPHWKDEGAWLGPRAWLTGQAAGLREISWKQTRTPDEKLAARERGLAWLLRQTEAGASLPQTDDHAAMQTAADRLARTASRQDWSRETTLALFRRYAGSAETFRDANVPPPEQRRRGEVLSLAVNRLWTALKMNGQISSENLDKALVVLAGEARKQEAFDAAAFAGALQTVEAAVELLPK